LADTLGISRQSLNHELKNLQALGCIELSYSRVSLLDLPQLEAMRIQQG
jgi:CRP/FNR family cyclic AMP-dependent transcriptional regulator